MNLNTELQSLTNWTKEDNAIKRTIVLQDFKHVMAKMMEIAFYCEELNHHPEWFNVYNKLEIKLTTHDEGGLSMKDVELAKVIDRICPA